MKKAASLIKKFPDEECLFGTYYGEKELVCTYDGTIDFDPEGYKSVVGADRFTYDEYLEVQIKSFHKTRDWFETCFHNIPLGFKGCIEKNTGKRIRRTEEDGMKENRMRKNGFWRPSGRSTRIWSPTRS